MPSDHADLPTGKQGSGQEDSVLALRVVQWVSLAVATGYLLLAVGDQLVIPGTVNAWACVLTLYSMWLLERRGARRLAACAMLVAIWFGIALSALSDGMSASKGLYLMPALPCVAAHLLGEKAGIRCTWIAAATIVLVIVGDALIDVPNETKLVDDGDWVSFRCVEIAVFAVLANLQASRASNNLQRQAAQNLELDQAKAHAERASLAKSAFLARVSHEVRTPMHGILGMTQTLATGNLDANDRACVEAIERCADSLQCLLNDGLELSAAKGGQAPVERRSFAVDDVIRDIVMLFSAKAQLTQTELEFVAPQQRLYAWGDPKRTRQVLTNLVGNALKFGAGSRVWIEVAAAESAQGEALVDIAVCDQGIGISLEDQRRIFEPYQQVDESQAQVASGTGLGLMISQDLAEQMQGEIQLRSTLGEGSRFALRLQAAPSAERPSSPEQVATDQRPMDSPGCFEGNSVLLVDDNAINRRVASVLLRRWGLEIYEAQDGEVALRYAKERKFDLVFMDLQMPKMDGIEATKGIRAQSLNQTTPIVALTANAFPEDEARSLLAGMNEHVAKPCKREQLFEVCARYLHSVALREARERSAA